MARTPPRALTAHRKAGDFVAVDSHGELFVREAGKGRPVVLLHGLPASSFTYRKMLPKLAEKGVRAIAIDLPGLGFSSRPAGADYSYTGLGRAIGGALDGLGLDEVHLVVHDLGGPVGFEVIANHPGRVTALTVLNTPVRVDRFRPYWLVDSFRWPGIGELGLKTMAPGPFRKLMRWLGVENEVALTDLDCDAYLHMLRRDDGGRAFLQIMRSMENTVEKGERYEAAVRSVGRIEVIWGACDRALPVEIEGKRAAEIAGVPLERLPARHFLQEEYPGVLADRIAVLA